MRLPGTDRVRDAHEGATRGKHAVRPALGRIVVGVDFMRPSIDALRWVTDALAPEAELILVHGTNGAEVAPGDRPPSARARRDAEAMARARLRALADAVGGQRAVRVEVREDRPAAAIAYVADTAGADVIVVGPHGGRETIRGIGSTAERLVRMSPIPVLLVTHPRSRAPERLVVALDQGPLTHEVMRWADLFARDDRANLVLTHVLDPRIQELGGWQQASVRSDVAAERGYPTFSDFLRETETWLAGAARELSGTARVALTVSVGEPGHEIIALAQRTSAELIVIGRRGRWRRVPAVVGSTASTVLRAAPCPTLVVVDPPEAQLDPWAVED